jgi:hypothetical protein
VTEVLGRRFSKIAAAATLWSLLAFAALPVHAEDYIKPTLIDFIHTLVRFGAVNLDDTDVIDDYARLAECDLYIAFYHNDFKWHQIQKLLRQKLEDGIPTYPTAYYIDEKLQLGRYDFDEKLYRFTDGTAPKNTNAFTVYDDGFDCGTVPVHIWPLMYRFVINTPVTLLGLPIFEKDAETLLNRMNESGNNDHIVYTRFKMRVLAVGTYSRAKDTRDGKFVSGLRSDQKDSHIDSNLDSVEFYEDPKYTKLIYVYRP